MKYTLQRFQGEHKNEFLLQSENGDFLLFENNVLKQQWQEHEEGKKSEEFTRYKNGRVDFRQPFDCIFNQTDYERIVNTKKGLRMELRSIKTGNLLYYGGFNDRRQKEGWGIEYDRESNSMTVEGIWNKGTLKEVIRVFKGDTMTELKRNGADSLDPVKRIPIYVGGFRYDEESERFYREGTGSLIDAESGIATRECEWKDGKEVSGVDLHGGCYDPASKSAFASGGTISNPAPAPVPKREPAPTRIKVTESAEWADVSLEVTDLVISSNCCNELNALDLNKFEWLRSIEIGDDCFGSVRTFKIEGLKRLKSVKIGNNSFTQVKKANWDYRKANNQSRSFHILDCESLESIQIGKYSFCDFGGGFELSNLKSLKSIQIGTIGSKSNNFYCGSLVIQGMDMILTIE